MIQLEPARLRAHHRQAFASLIIAFIARIVLFMCVFAYTQNIFVRLGFVCALYLYGNSWASYIAYFEERLDALQLKLWSDELTWRTAFGRFINGEREDWNETIRQSSKYAVQDIKQAKDDADFFEKPLPIWIAVFARVVIDLTLIIGEAAIAVWATPHFVRFLISIEASPYFRWWIQ